MQERLPQARPEATPAYPAFDLHHAMTLFIASFNHSQGNEALQDWLFAYLSRQHPQVRMSEKFRNQLTKRSARVICHLFKADRKEDCAQPEVLHIGHVTLDSDLIDLSVDKEVRQMQEHFAGLSDWSGSLLLTDNLLVRVISQAIIERDHYWLLDRPDGRPNRRSLSNTDYLPSHWTDPHFSYVVEHALKGHLTEAPEFDHLYAQIGERYRHVLVTHNQEKTVSSETYDKLQAVIAKYNQTHSDEQQWQPLMPFSGAG